MEQALELEGGSITRAAERLKRQTLANMLVVRHKKLLSRGRRRYRAGAVSPKAERMTCTRIKVAA
jgi:hypothetical protein